MKIYMHTFYIIYKVCISIYLKYTHIYVRYYYNLFTFQAFLIFQLIIMLAMCFQACRFFYKLFQL